VSGNELAAFPTLDQCPFLTVLDVSDNSIREFEGKALPVSLTSLNVGGNSLEELGKPKHELQQLTALRKLVLSSNSMCRLYGSGLACLSALTCLLMDGNGMTCVDGVEVLTQLEELDLSSNDIEMLPEYLGNLSRVKILHLESNKLRDLPNSILFCQVSV
jgi:Leucine-rich repeat (LRR) protein